MSDALTNATAAALNAARKLKKLDGIPLLLLDHATGATSDYVTIASVRAGFLICTDTEGIRLDIVEGREATAELLGRCVGCSFQEKVYKISGSDKKAPLGAPLKWALRLKPSGESYR